MDKVPQEMPLPMAKLPDKVSPAVPSIVPSTEAWKNLRGAELLPCPGMPGTCPGMPGTCPSEVSPIVVPVVPAPPQTPAKQPSQPVPRGSCLIHNWQEERATKHLDFIPGQPLSNESFIYRHGHRGLLTNELRCLPTNSTTMKDDFRPPEMARLLGRGQRNIMLESTLYQKHRKEMLEEMSPQRMPMESVSTTHRDYCASGQQFSPLPITQPHNYYTDQPCSFWLEHALRLPHVTSTRSEKSPFRRNAAFTTPVSEYLGQSLPL